MRWSRPGLLWFTFASLASLPLDFWISWKNRRIAAELGTERLLRQQADGIARSRWVGRLFLNFAWVALVVAAAGPHWGASDDGGVARGRDVVVVLDFSRSMLATDLATPATRWQAARDAVIELIAGLGQKGGHRVAIVIFAARASILVPLTTDYDHLNQMLDDLDGNVQPLEIRPADDAELSGTRIGAALELAVAAHDSRFPGFQDIILISDGDDPAEDREWTKGIAPARNAGIPIHTVGIGDLVDSPLILPKRGYREGELISTKLHEEPLKMIARETRGDYRPARRESPRLGEFASQLVKLQSRDLTDDSARGFADRSAYFWLAGCGFALAAWFWRA